MVKALDENVDREDAIISISDKKVKTSDIGKIITLDLTTRENEFENLMFPLNLMFDPTESMNWCLGMLRYYQNDPTKLSLYQKFNTDIISSVIAYKLPVIKVLKNTSQSSVCQIFLSIRYLLRSEALRSISSPRKPARKNCTPRMTRSIER